MTKHFHVLLWVPLMYAALFFAFWVRIYQNELISFEDYVLEIQTNYATDSAIAELLHSSDLNQDYADGDSITLEPSLATDDIAHTMCINYGYIPTEYTEELVKNNNIRALLVCTYDGIYAHYKMQTTSTDFELKQTPKIPYFYTTEDGGKKYQYCLTLDKNKGYWTYYDSNKLKLHSFDTYDGSAPKISEDLQKTAINDYVGDIMNWALYESYEYGKSDAKVRLPAMGDMIKSTQPIDGPAVLAVLDGNTKVFSTYAIAESIGGSQIENADNVIGYTLTNAPIVEAFYDETAKRFVYGDNTPDVKNGLYLSNPGNYTKLNGKYYAYQSWWEKHKYLLDYTVDSSGHYFDTAYEAAQNGYNDLNTIDTVIKSEEITH